MKKCLALFLALLLWTGCASAELTRSPLTETAMTLLPDGDPFVTRYNAITGAQVEPLFPQGVPYFFGGKNEELVFARYPDYAPCKVWAGNNYYKTGKFFFAGFDCAGFISYVRGKNGLPALAPLEDYLIRYADYREQYLFTSNSHINIPMPAYGELKDVLTPGDLLVISHGAHHIMMYIGTLRDFGYTADVLPMLADYLDYPLVIHCGGNPTYAERFQELIDADPDQFGHLKTTDGGVQVSLLGAPQSLADTCVTVRDDDYYYFFPDGWPVTIVSIEGVRNWSWVRLTDQTDLK